MVPMKTRLATRLAVLMLSFQLCGCATLKSYWPWSKPPPPPPAPVVVQPPVDTIPPTTVVEAPEKPKKRRVHAKKPVVAPAGAPVQTQPEPEPTPEGATNVTLEDNDADRRQAQALLDDADSELARIDRSKLSGEDTAAYNQANDLTNAARKAMGQNDYLAASGLARKASLLEAQLTSHNQSH
jgi:outer membrane biosynthesis protein TonB